MNDGEKIYKNDAFNRVTRVETTTGQVQINRYDAEGLRYEMEENKKLVQFIFNENREVVVEQSNSDIKRLIRSYDLWASESEPEKTWYHYASDEQGSTIFITDKEKICNKYDYDAWGNLTTCEEIISNRYLYTGQQFDQITQQYYLRARYYNPVIARFTQEDVYRGDGLNLYTYCDNNPVIYYDPSGYAACSGPKSKNPINKSQKEIHVDFIFADNVIVPKDTGYSSFKNLKSNLPKLKDEMPGKNTAYHHISEQNSTNMKKYSPEFIHNKQNIVPLENGKGSVHRQITGYYNSKDMSVYTGGKVRDYVNNLSADQQVSFGINRLNKYGDLVWNAKKGHWELK